LRPDPARRERRAPCLRYRSVVTAWRGLCKGKEEVCRILLCKRVRAREACNSKTLFTGLKHNVEHHAREACAGGGPAARGLRGSTERKEHLCVALGAVRRVDLRTNREGGC
jgi:hypothetical protein